MPCATRCIVFCDIPKVTGGKSMVCMFEPSVKVGSVHQTEWPERRYSILDFCRLFNYLFYIMAQVAASSEPD